MATREPIPGHVPREASTEGLRDSDRWTAFLALASYAYSPDNVLVVLRRRLDASRVAGFRTSEGLRRQVRTSDKAVRILGHSTKKVIPEVFSRSGHELAGMSDTIEVPVRLRAAAPGTCRRRSEHRQEEVGTTMKLRTLGKTITEPYFRRRRRRRRRLGERAAS